MQRSVSCSTRKLRHGPQSTAQAVASPACFALFVDSLAIDVPADCRLLDLGCGTGELARALAARGAQATACDFSIEMLHRAAKCDAAAAVEWIRLQPGWQKLPFDPSVFDAVVAASVLEYVDDAAPVFMECARVLRPGGFMLCTVPNVDIQSGGLSGLSRRWVGCQLYARCAQRCHGLQVT